MAQAASSALYSARLRFVEGLPARAHELSSSAERLARDPEDPEALQLLRRRLHALLASAQVFEEPALSLAVQDLISRLELAQQEQRALSNEEIDAVIVVVASLPTYVRPSLAPPAAYSDVRELSPVPEADAEVMQLPAAELHHDEDDDDDTPPVFSDARDLRPPTEPAELDVELPPSDAERDAIVELDRALGIEPEATTRDAHERPTLDNDPRQALSLLDPERPTLTSDPRAVLALAQPAEPELDVTIDWTEVAGLSLEEPEKPLQASDDEHTDPGLGPPVLLDQTVSGLLPAPQPSVVLAVGRPDLQLTGAHVELVYAEGADEAVRLLHEAAPDLVLISAELASHRGADLVRRLKTDPLHPAPRVHVLLEADAEHEPEQLRELGADGVLREPLDAAALEPLLGAPSERRFGLREASIDDIAAQIAEEIRRGIAESLRAGNSERVQAGDGSELMAAAWSAIGRVRSHFAEQQRVRGTDVSEPVNPAQLLAGCRVLVADDDPAVLWFFAGLLRESSAQVLQAHNGREALELARRKQPHVVVSDILMPKLDGFGLCRELRRDVLLAQVPVVLLSWKDDLLERMRELDSGARGYLRKEAGAQEILRVLRDVLAPRTRLSQQLRAAGEVRGTLDVSGPYALLELVAAERPDAHVVVRDASHVFEVDIRGGRRLSVTRTAADGSFTRGDKALMQLLGLGAGEFEVQLASAPLRAAVSEPLERALAAAGRRLAALLDAVSDARLLRVSLIAFDEDVLASLLSEQNTRLREVVALFRTGHATAEGVLREGKFAPGELEGYLRKLARGAAITGVWDAQGEDLVAASQREREMPQLALLSSAGALRASQRAPDPGERETPVVPIEPVRAEVEDEPVFFEEVGATAGSVELEEEAAERFGEKVEAELARVENEHEHEHEHEHEAVLEGQTAQREDDTLVGIAKAPEPPPEVIEPPPEVIVPPPAAAVAKGTLPFFGGAPAVPPAAPSGESVALAAAAPSLPVDDDMDAVSNAERKALNQPLSQPPLRPRRERSEGLRLFGTLLVLAAFGYFGWQQLTLRKPNELRPAPLETTSQAVSTPTPTPAEPSTPAPEPALPNTQVGRVLPFVDNSRGVNVGANEGLLVLEYQGSDPAPSVRVGERDLGKPPLSVALPAGRHELVVRAGKSTSFRYLILRAGETRVVTLPLAEL